MTEPQALAHPERIRPADNAIADVGSRQVSWWEVYSFAERYAAGHALTLDHHLIAGTPQWCGMADDDARKLLAVLLGGVRDALRNDTHQAAAADASKAVSASTDWPTVARERRQLDAARRSGIRIERKKTVA